jgi:hypothetical protein
MWSATYATRSEEAKPQNQNQVEKKAEVGYGETAGLVPEKSADAPKNASPYDTKTYDPKSTQELQDARTNIMDISERNSKVKSGTPSDPNNPIQKKAFNDNLAAAKTATEANLESSSSYAKMVLENRDLQRVLDRESLFFLMARSEMSDEAMYRAGIKRTSIFMTNRVIQFFLFTLLVAFPCLAQQKAAKEPLTLAQRVARLGADGNDDIVDVKELAKNPRVGAGLLIADLHTIPDSEKAAKQDSTSMEHVLWIIRALRYVTGGMDFCATSEHRFGSSEEERNRKYWLTLDHKECLAFFAIWPSRDRTYIAPVDAQKKIIVQWKEWYATSSTTFEYKPLQDPAPEKWIW